MSSLEPIRRENDRFIYQIEGNWDELEVAKIVSRIDILDNQFLIKYTNFQYKPPVKGKRFLFLPYTIEKGVLTFESDPFDFTLKEYIEMQEKKQLDPTMIDIIISQVLVVCNKMRESPEGIQVISLHPSNIAMKQIPYSDPPQYTIHLLAYIPMLFKDVFSEEQNLFICPSTREQISSHYANDAYAERTEIYSLGCLIAYLNTGKLPYHYGTTPEMLEIDYENNCIDIPSSAYFFDSSDSQRVENIIQFLKGIFLEKKLWKETFQNPYISHCVQYYLEDEKVTIDDLHNIEYVGNGQFGVVYKAEHITRSERKIVAIKEMIFDEDKYEMYDREISILRMCEHPNVIKMYDVLFLEKSFCDEKETGKVIDIIMEFCDGGDVGDFFEDKYPNIPMDENMIKHVLASLIKGLSYLHNELNVYHRDLKPQNILIKKNQRNPSRPLLKITDFGLSKIVESGNTQTVVGTPLFMAPQIHFHQIYSEKCDLWSLGVIMYFLKTREYPFGCNENTFLRNLNDPKYPIYQNSIWNKQSHFKTLVKGLIVQDEHKRFGWNDIMSNPYVISALDQYKRENK